MNKSRLKGLKMLVIIESIIIALLSVGTIFFTVVMVIQMNTSHGVISTMSQQEKQIFNAKFESYASEKQSSGNTKALISAAIASNESNATDDGCKGERQVLIGTNFYTDKAEETWTTEYLSRVRAAVKQGNTYAVELIYGDDNLVTEIKITQNKEVKSNNTL